MRLRLVVLLRSRSVPLVGCVAQLKYGALRAALGGVGGIPRITRAFISGRVSRLLLFFPLARTHSSPSILSSHLCDFL